MRNAGSAAYADVSEFDMEVDTDETLDQKDAFKWKDAFKGGLNAARKNDSQFTPVTVVEEPKKWLHDFIKKLTRLSTLDGGWDSYGAEAPNQWAIDCAREVLKNLSSEDLKPSSIDASAEGGVCLSFQSNSRYGDIECFNSGEIFAVTSKNGEDTEVWEIQDPIFHIVSTINRIQYFMQSKM